MAEYFRFRCTLALITRRFAVKHNSLIRVSRRAEGPGPLEGVRQMRCPDLPFEITVSRLLSSP